MKFLAFLSFKNAKSTIDKFKIKCYSTDRTDDTDNTDKKEWENAERVVWKARRLY